MRNVKGVLSFYFFVVFIMSCDQKKNREEMPLATVVKLISAESNADFDEAKKYIDVEKVYSSADGNMTPEEAWKSGVAFNYSLGQDKRFTSNFKYYNYVLTENRNREDATVEFESVNPNAAIKKIIYRLQKNNSFWKVIQIEYKKAVN